jgi:hypothetical protein
LDSHKKWLIPYSFLVHRRGQQPHLSCCRSCPPTQELTPSPKIEGIPPIPYNTKALFLLIDTSTQLDHSSRIHSITSRTTHPHSHVAPSFMCIFRPNPADLTSSLDHSWSFHLRFVLTTEIDLYFAADVTETGPISRRDIRYLRL